MTPLQIYQEALDAVSQAVLAQRFEAYVARVDLPYLMCTLQASFVLHTPDDLRPTFDGVTAMMVRLGATHYERIAREAEMTRSDRIEGWHFTHILADGEWATAPWATRQVLVQRADGWKFSEVHFPFDTDRLPLTEEILRQAVRPGLVPGQAIATPVMALAGGSR